MSDPRSEPAERSPIVNVRPGCSVDEDTEPLGGDPPCWAHLFEEEDEPATAQEPRER
jgi:hypothetical protein